MDEDPLPKKSRTFPAEIILAIIFWSMVFAGLFLIVGYVFAQFTLGGLL